MFLVLLASHKKCVYSRTYYLTFTCFWIRGEHLRNYVFLVLDTFISYHSESCHTLFSFWTVLQFFNNFIWRLLYEDFVTLMLWSWFLLWYYIAWSFKIKNNSNSKKFAHVGFWTPKMLTKFWDFIAGMDFDT